MAARGVVVAAIGIVGCSGAPAPAPGPRPAPAAPVVVADAAPAPAPDAMTTPPIDVALDITPQPVMRGNLDQVRVRVTVTNHGARVLDPELGLSELRVNGAVSRDWSMALNNSGHPATWRALPPGQRVSAAYGLGAELFPTAGDYTVELVVSGVAAPPVHVHVAD